MCRWSPASCLHRPHPSCPCRFPLRRRPRWRPCNSVHSSDCGAGCSATVPTAKTRLLRARPRRRNAIGPKIAMPVLIAIAAARIGIETATAIETCGATVRGTRAGTAVHAATTYAATTAPDRRSVARTSPEARRLGKKRYRAKSKHYGQIKHLGQTRHPDPTNHPARINPAVKASDPPTSAASAADEAVADAVAADAKTTRMARVQTPVRATPRVRAMGTSAGSAYRCRPQPLPASEHPLNQHPSNPCVIRLPRHQRRHLHAPSKRRLRARERTTNTSCGPRPPAMFSALARTKGDAARAV
jgi:hypothetical protein